MSGSFSLPMKKTTKWAWENTWLVWAAIGLVIVPWAIAFVSVPNLLQVYQNAGYAPLVMVFLFGVSYGIGGMMGGLSIYLLGMSLAFSISLGLSTVLGSLIPMARDPHVFTTPKGIIITLGIAITAVGIVVCSVAGGLKEKQIKKAEENPVTQTEKPKSGQFTKGLIICILSGFFGCTLNFAVAFSDRIKDAAVQLGSTPAAASDAVWGITTLGAFTANVVYLVVLLTKNRTWSNYRAEGTKSYWLLAAIMGLLWMFSMTVYGKAASMMGPLGSTVGYAVLMSSIIMISNVWGMITGEWKDGKGKPVRTMYMGLGVLIVAICAIAYGNSL